MIWYSKNLFNFLSVSYRDPSNNNLVIVKNFRLDIKDFNSLPPQSTTTKKILNESVSNALNSVGSIYERTIESEQYQFRIRGKNLNRFYHGNQELIVFNTISLNSNNSMVRCLARYVPSLLSRRRSRIFEKLSFMFVHEFCILTLTIYWWMTFRYYGRLNVSSWSNGCFC